MTFDIGSILVEISFDRKIYGKVLTNLIKNRNFSINFNFFNEN